jgi:hypothetical protein
MPGQHRDERDDRTLAMTRLVMEGVDPREAWWLARKPFFPFGKNAGRRNMELDLNSTSEGLAALRHLLEVASRDTGQSQRVANFLLAWHNSEENGGWDPTDLWSVDPTIAEEMLVFLRMLRYTRRYAEGLGFEREMSAIWKLWRGERAASS